jgi:glycosyltransferase involved in cell wall biosynthesis
MSADVVVSVIIPTYNRAHLLQEAVESVLAQSLPGVEVIVVDDGSTDETRTTVECYGERLRFLVTEHGGAAHARNVGMRAARGKYVAFLDSDDRYLPGKLALQVAFLDSRPDVGMVSTEASAFDESGVLEGYHLNTYHRTYRRLSLSYADVYAEHGVFQWGGRDVPAYVGNVFRHVLLGGLIMSPTVMFRRHILEKVGYQNTTYRNLQEYEFLVRVCKHFTVAFLDVPTYLVRYHDSQLSMYHPLDGPSASIGESARQRKRAVDLEIARVSLRAVLDWGVGDEEFYRSNRQWLDGRVAQIHCRMGEMYLACSEGSRARACFRAGIRAAPAWGRNRSALRWSYCPVVVRRAIRAFTFRVLKRKSFGFYLP